MEPLPHTYSVAVTANPDDALSVTTEDIPELVVSPPPQFGGSGDQWSPEDLLVASLASCFVLSFRAIAKVNQFGWSDLRVQASGELHKVDRKTRFTSMTIRARLTIDAGEGREKAERFLQKAEDSCFISNSLNCDIHLESEIVSA